MEEVIYINNPWLVYRDFVRREDFDRSKGEILPIKKQTLNFDETIHCLQCIVGPKGWVGNVCSEVDFNCSLERYLLLLSLCNQYSFLARWFGHITSSPLSFQPAKMKEIPRLAFDLLISKDRSFVKREDECLDKLERLFRSMIRYGVVIKRKISQWPNWFSLQGITEGYTLADGYKVVLVEGQDLKWLFNG